MPKTARLSRASLTTVLVLVLAWSLPVAAQEPTSGSDLTLDVLFGENPGGRLPSQLQWAPDGRRLGYVWRDGDGEALWVLDVQSGERKAVLRADAEGGFPVAGYQWSPDGERLLLESAGDLHLLDLEDLHLHRFPETEGAKQIAAFSPDGGRVAYVHDFDLFVVDLASGEERALTTGGEENEILNAITDWVYWEEIWGRTSTGFWWSPDGARIAFYQFDESPLESYPLVDFQAVPYPEVEWQKYPKAGTDNPLVRVGVVALDTGEITWMRTGEERDVYLARVDWRPDGGLVIQRLNRDQNRLDLLACNAASGGCETLLTEEWPTWINLQEDLTFLDDGRFLRSSEKSGWRRLYLHAADGRELGVVSVEDWALTSLDAVDPSAGSFVYTAHAVGRLGATRRRVFRAHLKGGDAEPLTPADGWHSASVAPRTGNWVHRWSDANHPTEIAVRDPGGARIAELPTVAPPDYDAAALPAWKFLTIPGPDGIELPAALLEPAGLDPNGSYPAIMYHYGGPGSQVVTDVWSGRARGLWHKMMAQRGYAVLKVDNLASRHFGKHGEDKAHRRFGEINLAAQRAGVEYLSSLGWVDVDRIGLWGWSGGGMHTLYSVFNSPGTWRAAISGAPVTDWRLYDTIWTERFLDHPDDNAQGYALSSPVTYAEKLGDHLLIIHGTADDNVHPQNTLAMTHKLIEAGLPFEHAIYPRQKHGFRGGASRHLYERMTEFFDRHLLDDVGDD